MVLVWYTTTQLTKNKNSKEHSQKSTRNDTVHRTFHTFSYPPHCPIIESGIRKCMKQKSFVLS